MSADTPHRSLWSRAQGRLIRQGRRTLDSLQLLALKLKRAPWPCPRRQFLVVGCESSGTTVISRLLFDDGSRRFLLAGARWAWPIYMNVYQGLRTIRDYPRLQLYDGLKLPGFAAVLDQYVVEFPAAEVVYVVRDPRDVLASAYRSMRISSRDELSRISWVAEDWLKTPYSDPVARLGFRWRTYLEVAQRVPRVRFVRYEDFCADKVGTIQALAAQIGVAVDTTRLAAECDTQASHPSFRNYAPAGPGAKRRQFVTEADEALLSEVCGPLLTKWGYTP